MTDAELCAELLRLADWYERDFGGGRSTLVDSLRQAAERIEALAKENQALLNGTLLLNQELSGLRAWKAENERAV